jgi:hypothetical protein
MENNLLYKQNKNKEFTSVEKSWFEEALGNESAVKASEIWADTIPQEPPEDTNTASNVIKYIQINLTEDFTTPGHKAWFACEFQGILSSRLFDFIQPSRKYSEKYLIDITDADGKPLKMGAVTDWNFDYSNGILTFKDPVTIQYKTPFKLRGWKYIGKKGVFSSGFSGTGSSSSSGGGATNLQQAYYGGQEVVTMAGPVKLSGQDGFAPLQLTELDSVPINSLKAGQIFVQDGIPYIYNKTIGRFVSVSTDIIQFSAKRASGVYLTSGNSKEWIPPRDCYIINIDARSSSGYLSKNLKITSGVDNVISFNLVGGKNSFKNQRFAIQKNKPLKIKASSVGDMTYNLMVTLEIAYNVNGYNSNLALTNPDEEAVKEPMYINLGAMASAVDGTTTLKQYVFEAEVESEYNLPDKIDMIKTVMVYVNGVLQTSLNNSYNITSSGKIIFNAGLPEKFKVTIVYYERD